MLNHWGAVGGTPRQGLRAGAADPQHGRTMTRATARGSLAGATEATRGEEVPPYSMALPQPWGRAQGKKQPSTKGVAGRCVDSGAY